MKLFKFRNGFISGNAIRVSKGLALGLPLLLAGPAAVATVDLGPPGSGGSSTSPDIAINADAGFRDPNFGGIAHSPPVFRELPLRRLEDPGSSSGVTISDDPPVLPEPSAAIAASLLLLPLGVSAVRMMRNTKRES